MSLSPQDIGPLQKSLSAYSLDIVFYFSGDSHVAPRAEARRGQSWNSARGSWSSMAPGLCLIVCKSLGPQCAMLPAELGNKTSSLIYSLLMGVGELWWSLLSVQDPMMAPKKRKYSDLTTEASHGGSEGENIGLQCGRPGFYPWIGKIPWRRQWQPL